MNDDFNQTEDHTCQHTSRDVLRTGDVLAVGLDNGMCQIGAVSAANEDAFRLDLYLPGAEMFAAGPAVVMWHQVIEFGPFAWRKDARTFDMAPLIEFQLAWAEEGQ